jgi:hypothetical protein
LCPDNQPALLISQRHFGITKMRPPKLIEQTPSSATIATHGASELFLDLPQIDAARIGSVDVSQAPAKVDCTAGLPCDCDLGMIHFDRTRDETAENQTG